MRLFELFSHDPENKDTRLASDIDYASDLKFFIDNDDELTSQSLFPAVKKHKHLGGSPDQYQVYLDVVKSAIPKYCEESPRAQSSDDIPCRYSFC